jgi:hypothetical protein
MALEDEYPDILQNIEFAIISVYREKNDFYDFSVMRALDALIEVYSTELRGRIPKTFQLPEPESLIFERTKAICEMRLGRNKDAQALLGDAKPLDVIFACLKKIRKSVDRWNKRGGRRGYLQFASQFIM